MNVQFHENDHVLDAGCGTGYSLFYLCEKNNLSGLGISISGNEIESANLESERLNLAGKVEFRLMSYDAKLPGHFNSVLAIESLKHSNDLLETLSNLLGSLAPNGQMIIADDFVISDSVRVLRHKELWSAHSFTTIKHVEEIIQECGEFEVEIHDLTKWTAMRSRFFLYLAKMLTDLIASLALRRIKRNLKTYKGALLLEELYKRKQVGYYILIIKSRKS
jgi:cyclopropane fatty-acyl-phospholipid synthase-like methyltransferase